MILKRLDKVIRHVSLAMRLSAEDRRNGDERRKINDRRSEPRYGESPERRINPERRQALCLPVQRYWYESLTSEK